MHNIKDKIVVYTCTICKTSRVEDKINYRYISNVRIHIRKQHLGGIHKRLTATLKKKINELIEKKVIPNPGKNKIYYIRLRTYSKY